MNPFLCFLFLVPFCVSASSGVNKQIIGGKPTSIAYYPYFAHLEVKGFICGASIIGEFWLMTSGFCKYWNAYEKDWMAVVGTERLDFLGSRQKVTRWVQHPQYDSQKKDYDFALIKVGSPLFSATSVAKPVDLPANQEPTPNNAEAVVCGFGQVYPEVKEMSNKLHVAVMKTFTEDNCKLNLGEHYTPRKLCAREYRGNVSVASSDLGGPLVVNNTLYGVIQVKYKDYFQDIGVIKTFSRVAAVRDWIKEVTKL